MEICVLRLCYLLRGLKGVTDKSELKLRHFDSTGDFSSTTVLCFLLTRFKCQQPCKSAYVFYFCAKNRALYSE